MSEKKIEWENALSTLKKEEREVLLSDSLGGAVWRDFGKISGEKGEMPIGESILVAENEDVRIFMNRGLRGYILKKSEQLKLL